MWVDKELGIYFISTLLLCSFRTLNREFLGYISVVHVHSECHQLLFYNHFSHLCRVKVTNFPRRSPLLLSLQTENLLILVLRLCCLWQRLPAAVRPAAAPLVLVILQSLLLVPLPPLLLLLYGLCIQLLSLLPPSTINQWSPRRRESFKHKQLPHLLNLPSHLVNPPPSHQLNRWEWISSTIQHMDQDRPMWARICLCLFSQGNW